MTAPLIQHIESYLGQIQGGWHQDLRGKKMPFQIARTSGGVVEKVVSAVTVGLSLEGLKSPNSERIIHHELFFSFESEDGLRNAPVVLQELAGDAVKTNRAYLHGEVIGPRRGSVIEGTPFVALFVAAPSYWPDDFDTCALDQYTVVFKWLVPITKDEAHFIHHFGWEEFEECLSNSNLDMCDLARPELAEVMRLPRH